MGPVDENGNFIESPEFPAGQWLESKHGELWIIPRRPGVFSCPACGTDSATNEIQCPECGERVDADDAENPGEKRGVRVVRAVPDVCGPEDVPTPDGKNDTLKAICAILWKKAETGRPCDRLSEGERTALGLFEVPDRDKRFSQSEGYYRE